jgi:putative hydrolase
MASIRSTQPSQTAGGNEILNGRDTPVARDINHDINAVVGSFLRDLAYVQPSQPQMFGYKRAAAAILSLDTPLTDLVQADGSLPRIAGIGPASTRVIREVIDTGASPTVEAAIDRSDRRADIERRRSLRQHFLSRAEVLRILSMPNGVGPRPDDYCGDLQMHSEWSDGRPTLGEIAEGCLARGYTYAAVTDHSYGLRIAGGMSMADVAKQHCAIDDVNASYGKRFTLLRGIEANIDAEGRLDLAEEEAALFEIVLAAPHSRLRRAEDQTARLIAAIENPCVHILAHPRGRITGSRAGIIADWDAVFAAAVEAGVAIEIDGDPARQDLDHTLAVRARDAGCLFALDSDAHTIDQLAYADIAIAHARLAEIPADRIINYWPLDRLRSWLAQRDLCARQFFSPR